MLQTLRTQAPFVTESEYELPYIEIAYHVYGALEPGRPVIWIGHALTGSSEVMAWWPGMVGPGKMLDPSRYTVVCANVLGSCYGSTGATSINPATEKPYLLDFPLVTVRDMVRAHELLRTHLGIESIDLFLGASLGAFQGLEWCIMQPGLIKNMLFIAASARTSPWAKAFNQAQRMALMADPTFTDGDPEGGKAGLMAARAIGMVSYRSYEAFYVTQTDPDDGALENYRACTYQHYQGEKLARRFSPHAYYTITRAFDSHDVGRHRGGVQEALKAVKTRVHCLSKETDILFPVQEVEKVAEMIPGATHETMQSLFGHDGFLVENEKLAAIIRKQHWLK
jgi:homoserine O-acetyltransferase/O-succinyltransferase